MRRRKKRVKVLAVTAGMVLFIVKGIPVLMCAIDECQRRRMKDYDYLGETPEECATLSMLHEERGKTDAGERAAKICAAEENGPIEKED